MQHILDFYRPHLDHPAIADAGGNAGLDTTTRRALWDALTTQGLPTAKHEDWKYTPLHGFPKVAVDALGANHEPTLNLPDGAITTTPIADAHKAVLAAYDESNYLALHYALCTNRVHIIVERTPAAPIVLPGHVGIRDIYIDAKPGVIADIVEIAPTLTADALLASTTLHINIGEGAHLTHLYKSTAHDAAPAGHHFHHSLVRVARNGQFASHVLIHGAEVARRECRVVLDGARADAALNSLYEGTDREVLDSRTFVHHNAPNTTSRQCHKGLINGRATGVFNGKILVSPAALGTDGQMDNSALLLSDTARHFSKPQLEIFADDVACSHGFTCGELDRAQLFYMRARGIPEMVARATLIAAFKDELLREVPERLIHAANTMNAA